MCAPFQSFHTLFGKGLRIRSQNDTFVEKTERYVVASASAILL